MAERTLTKPEIASQKRVIKLPAAIGDWTTYRPPKVLIKKVKSGLYGFDRLSKEEVNQVLLIHYRFVQRLLHHFKVDLGMALEFLSCQIEQTTYLNFLRGLNESIVQGKLSIDGLHESIQLYFDLNLSNSVINHALGSRDLETLNRGLTEAERTAFTATVEEYLPDYTAAFEQTFANPPFSFVSSPDVTLDPSINPSATFISFAADIAINEMPQGKIIFGYPGNSLKLLLKAYNQKTGARPLNLGRLPSAVLNNIITRVAATLGKTYISTSEIHRLETGDVVSLDTAINAPVLLAIGDQIKILAQPGILDKKRALRIAGFKEEEKIELTPPLAAAEEKEPAPLVETQAPVTPEAVPEAELEAEPSEEEDLGEEEFPEEEEELTEEEFPEEFEEENPAGQM